MLKNLVLSNKLSRTYIIHYIQTELFLHISKLIPERTCVDKCYEYQHSTLSLADLKA